MSIDLKNKIHELSKQFFADTLKNRRHLHANPELSFQEYKTAAFVAEQLKAMGITPTEGVADTGLVALIEGKNPSSNSKNSR